MTIINKDLFNILGELYKIYEHHQIYINPLTAKLFNLNFHPFEVVSR